jgi:hypothetical protein
MIEAGRCNMKLFFCCGVYEFDQYVVLRYDEIHKIRPWFR